MYLMGKVYQKKLEQSQNSKIAIYEKSVNIPEIPSGSYYEETIDVYRPGYTAMCVVGCSWNNSLVFSFGCYVYPDTNKLYLGLRPVNGGAKSFTAYIRILYFQNN